MHVFSVIRQRFLQTCVWWTLSGRWVLCKFILGHLLMPGHLHWHSRHTRAGRLSQQCRSLSSLQVLAYEQLGDGGRSIPNTKEKIELVALSHYCMNVRLRGSWAHQRLSLSCSSTSAAMSSGPPDVTANQEPAEVVEECSGNNLIKCSFQRNGFQFFWVVKMVSQDMLGPITDHVSVIMREQCSVATSHQQWAHVHRHSREDQDSFNNLDLERQCCWQEMKEKQSYRHRCLSHAKPRCTRSVQMDSTHAAHIMATKKKCADGSLWCESTAEILVILRLLHCPRKWKLLNLAPLLVLISQCRFIIAGNGPLAFRSAESHLPHPHVVSGANYKCCC